MNEINKKQLEDVFQGLNEEEKTSLETLLQGNEECLPVLNNPDLVDYILDIKNDKNVLKDQPESLIELVEGTKSASLKLQELIDKKSFSMSDSKMKKYSYTNIIKLVAHFFDTLHNFIFIPFEKISSPYYKGAFSLAALVLMVFLSYKMIAPSMTFTENNSNQSQFKGRYFNDFIPKVMMANNNLARTSSVGWSYNQSGRGWFNQPLDNYLDIDYKKYSKWNDLENFMIKVDDGNNNDSLDSTDKYFFLRKRLRKDSAG